MTEVLTETEKVAEDALQESERQKHQLRQGLSTVPYRVYDQAKFAACAAPASPAFPWSYRQAACVCLGS